MIDARVSKAKKQDEAASRQELIDEKREDINLIKQALITGGISLSDAGKHAATLVLDHKINTVKKFQRKVGGDLATFSAILSLDDDDVESLEEYFQSLTVTTTAAASIPSLPPISDGAAVARDAKLRELVSQISALLP